MAVVRLAFPVLWFVVVHSLLGSSAAGEATKKTRSNDTENANSDLHIGCDGGFVNPMSSEVSSLVLPRSLWMPPVF